MSQNANRSTGGKSRPLAIVKGFFLAIGRVLATFIMVGIITGCIVACVMTVYILKYIGADNAIKLEEVKLGYTSFIYAIDPDTGQEYEVQRLYSGGENRIWISYDQMNSYTKDAIVAIEDKRFWEHQGVDWKRTAGAFLNLFVPIYKTNAGGSTITQQLVKNVTRDDDYRIERKVREIFRALNLAQNYSREQILEAYLNVVPFGNGTNGIQAASNLYFGKDAKDLTLAESAAIVGITQFPGRYDPFVNPDKNKDRQEHILSEMLDQGLIGQAEHDQAVAQQLDFKGEIHFQQIKETPNYFVDYVFEQVVDDLMKKEGYTRSYATNQIYQGGYRIYITMDKKIQEHLEKIYSSSENFPPVYNKVYPQSACVITDTNGKILALVGGIGEKSGARVFNRVTSTRQPGSSIKPLAAYSQAFEYNRVTWSTKIDDHPITLEEPGKAPITWPRNYYGTYYGMMTIEEAIQRSTNTIPVKLVDAIGAKKIFDFLTNELGFENLVEQEVKNGVVVSDVNLSAMALGGMTYGVTPVEMAGGYQIYANGGYYTKPYAYTEVRDSNGKIILKADTNPRQVLSKDTAVVVNKLLQRVVAAAPGTGRQANLGNMPTAGKTGTSSEDVDQWFLGITPYYVCQVWLGYDKQLPENNYGTIGYATYPPPVLFKTIMAPLHEGLEYKSFVESDSVVSKEYCTITGDLATSSCPKSVGWYKKSRIPSMCSGNHQVETEAPPQQNTPPQSPGGQQQAEAGFSIFDRITPSQQ